MRTTTHTVPGLDLPPDGELVDELVTHIYAALQKRGPECEDQIRGLPELLCDSPLAQMKVRMLSSRVRELLAHLLRLDLSEDARKTAAENLLKLAQTRRDISKSKILEACVGLPKEAINQTIRGFFGTWVVTDSNRYSAPIAPISLETLMALTTTGHARLVKSTEERSGLTMLCRQEEGPGRRPIIVWPEQDLFSFSIKPSQD